MNSQLSCLKTLAGNAIAHLRQLSDGSTEYHLLNTPTKIRQQQYQLPGIY